jgi:hypothetical protein
MPERAARVLVYRAAAPPLMALPLPFFEPSNAVQVLNCCLHQYCSKVCLGLTSFNLNLAYFGRKVETNVQKVQVQCTRARECAKACSRGSAQPARKVRCKPSREILLQVCGQRPVRDVKASWILFVKHKPPARLLLAVGRERERERGGEEGRSRRRRSRRRRCVCACVSA